MGVRLPGLWRTRAWLVCVAWFGCWPLASAQEELGVRRARALENFPAIVRGERSALAPTRADLTSVLAARPDDALARVHYGWLLVLAGRDLPLPQARDAAEAGFREMDAAVAAAPQDPTVRLVRARCAAQMPRALGRIATAESDLAWLVQGARAKPWPAGLRREIFFQAGSFALRQRDAAEAVRLLEHAARVPAPAPPDRDLQSMLALARRELSSQNHAEDSSPDQATPAAP